VTVKLTGFKELERALAEELPKATARNAMTRAATEAMEPMRERMAQLAPYDPDDRDEDGQHLRDTMRTQTAKARQARAFGVDRQSGVVVMTGPAPVGRRARANAGWQEYGTVKMGAKSYARVAADTEADAVIDGLGDALAKQIDKAKARIARKAARGR
jgi:hypothetical protein